MHSTTQLQFTIMVFNASKYRMFEKECEAKNYEKYVKYNSLYAFKL